MDIQVAHGLAVIVRQFAEGIRPLIFMEIDRGAIYGEFHYLLGKQAWNRHLNLNFIDPLATEHQVAKQVHPMPFEATSI